MNIFTKRLLITVISLISVFVFPWWVLLILASIMTLVVPLYVEMVVIGYWLDILYGINDDKLMLLSFLGVFLVVLYIKKNLLFK